MGKIVEKKKKKKGRPSLLDIQKRNLRLQKQQQQQEKKRNPNPNSRTSIPPNSNSNSSTPHRRFTRRNPNPDDVSTPDDDDDNDDNNNNDDDDDDDSKGTRRERKLNHVLRVNSNQRSSVNSPYLDLGLYGSDSNEDDENGETPLKKRKINAAATTTTPAGDGSALNVTEKGEKQNSPWKATEKHIGIPSVSGPTTTPLPDKKLLVFILDRLQKKDTYGVYAEPVDPEELPDYHEIIENPMDFGTVRKKLQDGAYPTLEQFENDVFLICSNAMQYNAPDTVYFKQARRIQELAKKSFENLRQDSDNEQRPKIAARRGRPPTKHLKKPLEKTTSERDGLDATLTKGGDSAIWSNTYNLRRGHVPDRYASADTSRRTLHGSRGGEAYNWLSENNNEKSDDFLGKGFSMKYGKRPFVSDESRRGTYMNFHPLVVGSESSVLNTFDGETKQLLPVGLHTEHGYARSLARFAATLGPVAWKVASKRIERALPPGMKFGPGWVGDDEAPPSQTSSLTAQQQPSSTQTSLSAQQQPSSTQTSLSAAAPVVLEQKGDMLLKQDITGNSSLDGYPNRTFPYTVTSSSTIVSESLDPIVEPAEVAGRVREGGFGLMNNGSCGMRPPFQVHQSPLGNPGMNGFSGGFGPNHSSQMSKLVRPVWSSGSINGDASVHSRILDMASKGNFIHSTPANRSELYNPKLLGGSSTANSGTFMPNSNHDAQGGIGVGVHGQACWNGLLLQQKPDLIPPDLNVRFQSPGSPSSSVRVDSPQPDLALQL